MEVKGKREEEKAIVVAIHGHPAGSIQLGLTTMRKCTLVGSQRSGRFLLHILDRLCFVLNADKPSLF